MLKGEITMDLRKLCLFFIVFLLLVPSFARAQTEMLEIKKEQLTGKPWRKRKYYYTFNEDGTYIKDLRLGPKRKPIFSCHGKYKIEGNVVSLAGFCPENKDKLKLKITEIDDDRFVADQYSFGAQLSPEGVLSSGLVYERVRKRHRMR
ncbi:MAG: hypothetical protein ACE5GM_03440 [bacterium]